MSVSNNGSRQSVDDEIRTIENIMAASLNRYNGLMPDGRMTYRERYSLLLVKRLKICVLAKIGTGRFRFPP